MIFGTIYRVVDIRGIRLVILVDMFCLSIMLLRGCLAMKVCCGGDGLIQ